MSVQKEGKIYFLVCDICGNAEDKDFEFWGDAVDYAKDSEWQQRYEGGGWIDICPECQK
jgi:hypothetical protein